MSKETSTGMSSLRREASTNKYMLLILLKSWWSQELMLISTSEFSLLTTKCRDIWLKNDIVWEMYLSPLRLAKVLELNKIKMSKKTLAQRGETGQKHSSVMEALSTFYSNFWRSRYHRKQSVPLTTSSNSRKFRSWLCCWELLWVLPLQQIKRKTLVKLLH